MNLISSYVTPINDRCVWRDWRERSEVEYDF